MCGTRRVCAGAILLLLSTRRDTTLGLLSNNNHEVSFTLAPAPPSVFYHWVHSDPARHCLQRTVVLKLESQIHGGAILERLRFNIDANFGSGFQRCEAVSCVGVLKRN